MFYNNEQERAFYKGLNNKLQEEMQKRNREQQMKYNPDLQAFNQAFANTQFNPVTEQQKEQKPFANQFDGNNQLNKKEVSNDVWKSVFTQAYK